MVLSIVSRQSGSAGSVLVNGEDRRIPGIDRFLKLSCYIQQDDALRPFLSVQESMIIAAHLKLGLEVPLARKQAQVMLKVIFCLGTLSLIFLLHSSLFAQI